ncbi:MAG TPA: type II secretion system F family protein [Gemmatimonadales bacterium]|nr:type II secretion system F family protein [Gemmatimonadales bacterium]
MTAFRYEAARSDGGVVRGMLDAASEPAAAAVLSARGLYPVLVEASQPSRPLFHRTSTRQMATVFESLAAFVDAGVPLEKALQATERVATGPLRDGLGRVAQRVREGSSLGGALAAEHAFSPVTVGLVRAGERGVGLGAALGQAAAQLEREAETEARVRSALTYPTLLAVVGSGAIALIVLFVIPRFAALLADLGQDLPTATRILLSLSAGVRGYGLLLGVAGVGLAIVAFRLVTERRAAWHAWLLRLPVVGALRHALASARASRTLGALLGSGTPVLAALEIAREAAGDAAVSTRIAAARGRVAEGQGLTAALDAAGALTANALQLAAIGEGSGRLPVLLAKAAQLDDAEAERRLKTLVSFLEPGMILLFAGLVAFVAAALLQAVYALRP